MSKSQNISKSRPLPPGTKTPVSGQWAEVGPRGGRIGTEITSTKGNPLPPSSQPGNKFVLTDPTKHKKK